MGPQERLYKTLGRRHHAINSDQMSLLQHSPFLWGILSPYNPELASPPLNKGFSMNQGQDPPFLGEHEFISVTGFVTGSAGLEIKALGGLSWYPNAAQTFLFQI